MSFFERLGLALRILFGGAAPAPPAPALPAPVAAPAVEAPPPPPVAALHLLGLLQREGRFVDFLQDDISQAGDADIGAAARVVHEGCRKVLKQYFTVAPVSNEAEGAPVQVNAGYDANRFRLTGNVTGPGPWKGALRHHGWSVTAVSLPPAPTTVDVHVLHPAELDVS
ncbi:MAG: DUF2760 domain-containing protein [Archangium sp.]|nr:DUF2760 domain-containing protein [Archangium sp.]